MTTRAHLDAACRRVYGTDRWASRLAADLTASGRSVSGAQVNHWQAGDRPIPAWVWDAVVKAWLYRSHLLRIDARAAREQADALAELIAPDPEPDQDDDLAPRM